MRKINLLLVCLLSCVAVWAQSLEIKKDFVKEPYSSALVKFANEFREHEMPDMAPGERFPYATICVNLEGDGGEVAAAKRTLSVEMGMAKVQERVTDKDNMIIFLVSSSAARVSLTCGDGCSKVRILDLPCLESNAVYSGTVHFVPYQEKNVTQAPQRQFFKFRVTPDNAVVTIVENGTQEILPMREGGIASKILNYGTYTYSIAADKYHTKEGTFTVSATQAEMKVDLLPQFGWLTVAGDNTSQGGYVFATNTATGGMIQLGTIPLNNKEMSSGVYTLRIQKEKYKDYSTTITIEDGKTTTLQPVLEANFAQVTLTTHEGADIYLDGSRLGTTRWTGTLELGDHSVEARQTSHHTAYTNVRITAQSTGQTITLNNPLPIYGSLVVDGSPADVAVYVDGKKVGTSPLLVSELLIGEHTVRLEKEGYDQQEKTVQIAENQESMLDFTLTKTVAKAPVVPAAPQGGTVETITVKGVSFNMIKVQGGTFRMGGTSEQGYDVDDDEKPIHHVTLSDYMIGETEVTQELWQAVMGKTLQEYAKYKTTDRAEHPMYYVSWEDCQEFITKLNILTGENFRLPTEAEWEYAARGGKKSKGYKYAGGDNIGKIGWYTFNSFNNMHPVKKKNPNELGLYDMTGNVLEWCYDWYDSYSATMEANPKGPTTGSERVCRGGSSWFYAWSCRISDRFYADPFERMPYCGLRLAL